jgi:chemosensory pili system protein ChpA (sensor histidine kinase/response regulator)
MARKPKILIVEDNEHNHPLFKSAFENAGFEVVIRKNGDGFFADEVSELKPDIISMDLMLGNAGSPAERDGFEAISALRGDLRTHAIPIIVLTSFFEEGKVKRAKQLGAVEFLNLSGEHIEHLPAHYLTYLDNPKRYRPSHPLFRES